MVNDLRWDTIEVRVAGEPVVGLAHLTALVRWLGRDPLEETAFLDGDGGVITDPMVVSWDGFPLQAAIDAAKDGRASEHG